MVLLGNQDLCHHNSAVIITRFRESEKVKHTDFI
jgi:hypothetical protein